MIPDPANPKKTCPRCESTNTKFCYFNNYSRAQPRHFCRGCSRYWTEGGTLRNVLAGGVRKNKRRKIAGDRSSVPDSMKSPVAAGSSCSDSSQYGFGGRDVVGGFEDGVFGMVNVSMENCWVNQEDVLQPSRFWNGGDDFADPAAFPASYWNFWDGGGGFAGDGDGEAELRG